MIKYDIQYANIQATKDLLKRIKEYIESDFYSEFSPPEESSSEEDYVYGIHDAIIDLYDKILFSFADKSQYRIMDNRTLFD